MKRTIENISDTFKTPPRFSVKPKIQQDDIEDAELVEDKDSDSDDEDDLEEDQDFSGQADLGDTHTPKIDVAENQEAFAELITDAYNYGQTLIWSNAYGWAFNFPVAKNRKKELDELVVSAQGLNEEEKTEFKALNSFLNDFQLHRKEYTEGILLKGVIKGLFQRYLVQAFKIQNITFENPWQGLIMVVLFHSVINAGLLMMATTQHQRFKA